MRHIHTSIVSRHLATRVNNTIQRTPPTHIISFDEILHRLIRRTLVQLRTNKSYLHKVDAKSHPLPLCPLYNTHHLFNFTHTHTTMTPLDLWTIRPYSSGCRRHCRPDGRRSRLVDHKREHQTSPLASVNGVGRQHIRSP